MQCVIDIVIMLQLVQDSVDKYVHVLNVPTSTPFVFRLLAPANGIDLHLHTYTAAKILPIYPYIKYYAVDHHCYCNRLYVIMQ